MTRQKRILTLDGGGVRGLSSLVILRKLLCLVNIELTGDDLPVAAKDVFDLIAGTGSGGLIALMLVKLDMTIDECLAEYEILTRHISHHQSVYGRLTRGMGKSRYSEENLAVKVRALIKSKGLEGDLAMTDNVVHDNGISNKQQLKTICSVICRELEGDLGRTRAETPVFLCSDICHAGSSEKTHLICTVCNAARAISAAPTHFPESKLFDKVLVDGSYGNTSNPSHTVFGHFQDWARLTSRHPQGVMMVNIGTGTMKDGNRSGERTQERSQWSCLRPKVLLDLWHITRDLSTKATECENMGKLMRQLESSNPLLQYWRFSEDKDMHCVALDDRKAVENTSIVKATEKYLSKPEILAELAKAARALALHSRAHRYAQRDGRLRAENPMTSSKSSNPQTSDEDSPDGVNVGVNLPADGEQFDDLKQPLVAQAEVNPAAKNVEAEGIDAKRRRRQSAGPGELFHSARADLKKALAEGKK